MKKVILLLILCILTLSLFVIDVNAQANYPSYTYDYWRTPLPSAIPYRVKEVIIGGSIDISLPTDDMNAPRTLRYVEDIFVSNDHYYLIDMTAAKLVITNKMFQVEHVIQQIDIFDDEGILINTYKLVRPRGVFVTDDGYVYITDENNQREGYIYILDQDLKFVARYERPNHPTYTSDIFRPNKIVVDSAKRMYIVVIGAFDGIVELQSNGEFSRFVGVQPVRVSPIELLWRQFMSREQRERMRLFLPIEYTAMSIDHEGFIYATASGLSSAPIQRINPRGTDVLRKNGYVDPIGDVVRMPNQNRSGLTSITVNEYGMYSVLDRTNKKIFTYNDEGYLNYVIGFEGEFASNFIFPTSLSYDGELIIVSDSTDTRTIITVLEPSDFGQKVNLANQLTYFGDSMDAAPIWEEVLEMNTNYSLAYIGIGHAYYRNYDFVNAMEAYQLGQDRLNYSKAYKEYRRIRFEENFPIIGTIVGLSIATMLFYPILKDLLKKEDDVS
jgi:hypothetical protein